MDGLQADLELLYPGLDVLPRLLDCVERFRAPIAAARRGQCTPFDERDVVLIAYPDHLQAPGEKPLATLHNWLRAHVADAVSTVHVLPFHPSTSYEGYAISDYLEVDPRLGAWSDLEALGCDFRLMYDFVLNHCSSEHPWFVQFRDDREPGRRYFHVLDDAPEGVVRARDSPLLSPVLTPKRTRHVWTTYSPDLVDLNWGEPDVCVEMCAVLLDAVARGARIVRLDAFVYIWKAAGTDCLDQPEGHALLRIFKRLLALAGADHCAILPSITNVSQERNYRYFLSGADLIYNLPLSALLLHALYAHDATHLRRWVSTLPTADYLNVAANHDGIGLTWLQGLLPESEVAVLLAEARRRGSLVSERKRTVADSPQPWELNCTYFSACAGERHVERFLATQAVLLALRGVPALYLTTFLAGQNDLERAQQWQDPRAVNRGRFDVHTWEQRWRDPHSCEAQVLSGLQRLLQQRRRHPAFHPRAQQEVLEVSEPAVFALLRRCPEERLLCLTSFAAHAVQVQVNGAVHGLQAYETRWLPV